MIVDEGRAVSEAYGHVAEGYRRALLTPALPADEIDGLRTILRAALELAGDPPLSLVLRDDEPRRRRVIA